MINDYQELNPIKYVTEITQVSWNQTAERNPELEAQLVIDKAQEVLGILENHGIEAKLTTDDKGITHVKIPRAKIDQLINVQKAVPLDTETFIKIFKKTPLSQNDSQKIENSLVALLNSINPYELASRSNLRDFKSFFQTLNIKSEPTSNMGIRLKNISAKVLQIIQTAEEIQENNRDLIIEEFSKKRPDVNLIKALIEVGAALNQRDSSGCTVLSYAIKGGNTAATLALLEAGADVNQENEMGDGAPLYWAIKRGFYEIIPALVDKGANVDKETRAGMTPLHLAADKGLSDVVRVLIDKGAKVNITNRFGETPLLYPSCKGFTEVIQVLIEKGADINRKNRLGETPLTSAIACSMTMAALALIRAGADVNLDGVDGKTPLTWAYEKDLGVVFEALIQQGADASKLDKEGKSILQMGFEKKLDGITATLLKGIDPNKETYQGKPLLHAAIEKDMNATVMTLLSRGADVHKEWEGMTPLQMAASKGRAEVIPALISFGADANQMNKRGQTPLFLAIDSADIDSDSKKADVIRALIKGRANVDRTNRENNTQTPLLQAFRKELPGCIQVLIDHGADFNKTDHNGDDPLYLSIQKGYNQIAVSLIKKGADPNSGGNRKTVPLNIAIQKGFVDVVQELLDKYALIDKPDGSGMTPFDVVFAAKNPKAQEIFTLLITRGLVLKHTMELIKRAGSEKFEESVVFLQNIKAFLHALHQHVGESLFGQFVQENHTLFNYKFISRIQKIKEDPITRKFLENIYAKLGSVIIAGELSPSEIERRLEQHPFILTQGTASTYIFHSNEEDSFPIQKEHFLALVLSKSWNLDEIREEILNAHNRQMPASGSYHIRIVPDELKIHPEIILKNISELFQRFIFKNLQVFFIGQQGADQGGLSRQFISDLFSQLALKMKFQKCDNGLFRPRLPEDSNGDFPALSKADKTLYRQLGQMMMFVLNASIIMPIGMLFDLGVFTAITKMDPKLLRKEFEEIDLNDPVIFDKMLGIYKDINRYIEDDMKMVLRTEQYLNLNEASPDELLQDAYGLVMGDPNIEQFNIGYDVKKMRQHLPQIKMAVQKLFIDTKLRPALSPIHEIAKGMKSSVFNSRLNFRTLQKMSPAKLSEDLREQSQKRRLLKSWPSEIIVPIILKIG